MNWTASHDRPLHPRAPRPWAVLVAAAALGGCGFSPPTSTADRQTLADCRSDADRVYNARNRAQLSERNDPDTPFSGSNQPSTPSDGLADRYSHNAMVADCVKHGQTVNP